MILLEARGEARLRIAAIGDVGVLGRARSRAARDGCDAVLAAPAAVLRAADLGFANLEFPVADPAWVNAGSASEFWHAADVPAALARAGVRVVSLANNHIMDCGERGLKRTLETCAAAGIATAGAGPTLEHACRPARLQVAGRRVAVLAYATPSANAARGDRAGFAPLEASRVRADVERARSLADLTIVSVHGGSMYVDYPPPRALEMADLLESLGVDLVIGHHPHVLQGFRSRGHTLTLFSLGDAVLDPAAGDFEARVAREIRRDSGVWTVTLADSPGLAFEPLTLDDDGVPMPASAERGAAILERLRRITQGLGDASERFRRESAATLLRYELESLGSYLRAGRMDRALRLLLSFRLRHLPILWGALTRGRSATRPRAGAAASDSTKLD
ncbi:MAG: CapA family protein [Candidatus Eisenbacteria bacterium]|nr:CapA family protein [Candidatus Eisenbacteria bacterium]